MPEKVEAIQKKLKKGRAKEMFVILLSSKIAMVGLVIVLFWVFVALFAPLLTPVHPL